MVITIETAIRCLFAAAMLICAWIGFSPLFVRSWREARRYRRVRGLRRTAKPLNRQWKWTRHVDLLLAVTLNRNRSVYTAATFWLVSAVLFLFAYLFFGQAGITAWPRVAFAAAAGFTPYTLLRLRLRHIQISSSYEGERLVSELAGQYKIHHFNMIEAIDRTIPRLRNEPYTRKALFRFSAAVKQYRSLEELEDLAQEFAYGIGTKWAHTLADSLVFAIGHGDSVQESLDDLLQELNELKRVHEKDKQENAETFVMVKYFAPGAYLFSVWAMFAFFGFTASRFIDYQFKHPLGLQYFLFAASGIAVNFILYWYAKRPKNDY